MPKQTAIDNFLKDIYTITKQQNLGISIVNIDTFEKLLVKYGLSKEDIKSYIATETGSNVYFNTEMLRDEAEISPSQFLENIKHTALSRLPRAIQLVVNDTPLRLSGKLSKATQAEWSTQGIAISSAYLEEFRSGESNISKLLHSLGHEYWHDFSHRTNFKENLKGMIKDRVDNVLQKEFYSKEKVKTIDELAIPLNFIEELTDGHILNAIEEEYVGRWGTKYIKEEALSYLENNLYKQIDKASIRGALDELMADALGHILTGTHPKVTNRGVVFILQKLAFKEKIEKVNSIIKTVDTNNPNSIEASVAELLNIIENCGDCGL